VRTSKGEPVVLKILKTGILRTGFLNIDTLAQHINWGGGGSENQTLL